MRDTVISFLVSVPVLSEHMMDTQPSASIAVRRRRMAWRLAIRCTPMAMVIVVTAGRLSGIADTAMPTTIMKASAMG